MGQSIQSQVCDCFLDLQGTRTDQKQLKLHVASIGLASKSISAIAKYSNYNDISAQFRDRTPVSIVAIHAHIPSSNLLSKREGR